MESFFSVDVISKKDKTRSYCSVCGKRDYVEVEGKGKERILFLSFTPESKKHHLSTRNRIRIKKILRKENLDLEKDCWQYSVIGCYGKSNDKKYLEYCSNKLDSVINELKPSVIIALGLNTTSALLKDLYRDRQGYSSIFRWRGWQVPVTEWGCFVCPTFEGITDEDSSIYEMQFEEDIRKAVYARFSVDSIKTLDYYKSRCKILKETSKINELLGNIVREEATIAFDYETTGLKPYKDGHSIETVSIYFNGISYAFVLSDDIKDMLCKVLRTPKVKKIGANIKFEQKWSNRILGVKVRGWIFDTVIASHILDNRTGISSVKFQTFVRYGIGDYADDIKPYLKSKDKENGGNAFNSIKKCPLSDLLLYNALDSVFEWDLAQDQIKEVAEQRLEDAYAFFHNATLALSNVEDSGFRIDTDYLDEQKKMLETKIHRAKRRLDNDKIIKRWKEEYGDEFNIASGKQMRHILFDVLGYEPVKYTETNQPAVDKEALQEMKISFAELKQKLTKYEDAKNTFIHSIECETWDGELHPSYNLNTVRTYRSSCNQPNFQNIPVRDKEIGEIVRGGIFARKGHILAEFDYSGVEVKIAYCYHQDPVMREYLLDPSKDMHRDVAMDCYMVPQEEMTKNLRYCGKNKFTFAQFYGDYYANCAKALWGAIDQMQLTTASGTPIREHLASQGIKSYKKFENHIKEVENIFWNKRFGVYQEWKEKWWKEYLKRGWFRTKTGFICHRLMGKNDCINYPIQGSAFHCLLWSLIETDKRLRKEGLDTRVMGQIHDSLILDINPDEKDYVLPLVKEIMTVDLRKHWKWITIPLEIEAELTEPGASWFTKKEVSV